jgi:hypothetical protein
VDRRGVITPPYHKEGTPNRMPTATPDQRIAIRYHSLSPTPGRPLTKGRPNGEWFGSAPAEGYVSALIEKFAETHPEAFEDLQYIANEAKWSTGWKGLGRMILEG